MFIEYEHKEKGATHEVIRAVLDKVGYWYARGEKAKVAHAFLDFEPVRLEQLRKHFHSLGFDQDAVSLQSAKDDAGVVHSFYSLYLRESIVRDPSVITERVREMFASSNQYGVVYSGWHIVPPDSSP